jgi:hypothetical protein
VYDAIFGPGTGLAAEAEKQRLRWKWDQAMKDIGWYLPKTTPLICRTIVVMAVCDVGMLEDPPGSNRGADIDALNDLARVPVGSYWCAAWVGKIWRNAGAQVPAGYASCDHWVSVGQADRPLDDPHRGARLCRGVRRAGRCSPHRHRDSDRRGSWC